MLNDRPSTEYPIASGFCSCNSDKGVGEERTSIEADIGFGLIVEVTGIRILAGFCGTSVDSRAISRGKFGEVSVASAD